MQMRRDIQGLRAIAVTAVLLEHTFGAPSGGYLGVDVFFVLSGFLITSLLHRELAEVGGIRLLAFWRRRFWRLAPSFLVVVVATVGLSLCITPGAARGDLAAAVAAIASVANWYYLRLGTDYFAALGPVSVFQHTWSLSVEEQFYVVWPPIVAVVGALCWKCSGPRTRHRATVLLLSVVLAAASAASLLVAFRTGQSESSTAYFSTITRIWELGTGALLAGLGRRWRLSNTLGTVVSWAGLATIVLGLLVIDAETPAPAPAALLCVVGTGAVLVGGRSAKRLRPLENPLSDRLASISYVLYLWHFPVLTFVKVVAPGATWASLPVAVLLAIPTHLLVEQPLRHGISARRGRHRPTRSTWQRAILATLAAAGLVAVVGLTRPTPLVPELAPVVADGAVRERQEAIGEALRTLRWSDVDLTARVAEGTATLPRSCGSVVDRPSLAECTFGAATSGPTVVVVGDSLAATWLDALVPWFERRLPGWRLVAVPTDGCPAIDLPLRGLRAECSAATAAAMETVAALRPEVVLLTSKLEDPFGLDGTLRAASDREVRDGTVRWLREIRPLTGRLVHLLPPPAGSDLRACRSPLGTPAACVAPVSRSWHDRTAMIRSVAAEHGDIVVDTTDLVARDGLTPAFVDRQAVRMDRVHLDRSYARSSSDALGQLIAEAVPEFRAVGR